MNTTLTASAVFCAALISGCSSAPKLPEPTGEWESFTQVPSFTPPGYLQPTPPPASAVPVATVYKPAPAATFVPPVAAPPIPPVTLKAAEPIKPLPIPTKPQIAPAGAPAAVKQPAATPAKSASLSPAPAIAPPAPALDAGKVLGREVGVLSSLQPKDAPSVTAISSTTKPAAVTAANPPATPAKPVTPAPKPPQAWSVSPQDKTIRETLAKWAAKEGWTFNPIGRQHWTVAEDFDVVASDTMYGSFIEAVQQLVGTTELTKTPLQPCFYSNRVVRVIYINEQCSFQTAQLRNP